MVEKIQIVLKLELKMAIINSKIGIAMARIN